MTNKLVDFTVQTFKKQFGEDPDSVYMSPGRINIIGEHIDYNNGFVLPAAIDKYICFAIKATDSELSEFYAADYNEKFTVNVNDDLKPGSTRWANYMLGVIHEIKKLGKKIGSFKVALSSDVPIGAGLSSSAALECGFAYALDSIYKLGIDRKTITIIGQSSEHNFAGVKCGIMDQFASVFGKKDKVIKLDCNTLDYTYYDAKLDDHCLVLFDSCVKHTHLTSGYNDRRNEVDRGISIIKANYSEVKDYRDVTHDMLEKLKGELGEVIYKRCRYVIEEIKRVEEAALALQNQDFKKLGELLNETHKGLSQDYEVSCSELDFLVEEVLKEKGVSGARMMGGGFGGCTINLIKKADADNVIASIQKKYKDAFNIDMKVYQVNISEGTHKYEGKY
ncbi:galactokinase [Anaeromyces robustus]|uniref:Galactokinase n=1 Tax=Anaeromyces robustus TaxID=1754192 RepID=A0A1Y1XQ60_9FUNG|nr:galactokinase [Anaeromyces robustus]|eukprot:ORX87888.1 galactokinase [Anaeromyces robustus]